MNKLCLKDNEFTVNLDGRPHKHRDELWNRSDADPMKEWKTMTPCAGECLFNKNGIIFNEGKH